MKVQILIPAYNADKYISQTLDSVLCQEIEGLDVIVLDNCSTDGTVAVVDKYQSQGVRLISSEYNIGAIGNHNKALDIADGDYIKLLSADDVLLPGMLKKQIDILDKFSDVGIVTCNCIVTDRELKPISETLYLSGHQFGNEAIRKCVSAVANLIGAPSNTLLRNCMIQNVRLNPDMKWLADLDFACQILNHSNLYNIDEFGFLYRRHETTDSELTCTPDLRFFDENEFIRRYGGGLSSRTKIQLRHAKYKLKSLMKVLTT